MNIQEATDRIAKLLRLAEKAGTPEEAANAAAKASALMVQYGIEQSMLADAGAPTADEPIVKTEEPIHGAGKSYISAWRYKLASVIGQYHNVIATYSGPRINLVGRRNDVQTVRYLFTYLEQEIDSLTKKRTVGVGEGKGYANSFRLGVIDTVDRILYNERQRVYRTMTDEAGTSSIDPDKAIARVKSAIDKRAADNAEIREWAKSHIGLRESEARDQNIDYTAYRNGRAAGNVIVINHKAKGSLGSGKG